MEDVSMPPLPRRLLVYLGLLAGCAGSALGLSPPGDSLAASEQTRGRGLLDAIAGVRGAPTLSRRGIERQLPAGTLLLEYSLGEERSVLWAVSRSGVASFELPSRARIEGLARRAFALLRESDRRHTRMAARRAAAELSHLLLGPVADRLAGQRLLFVPDGALAEVPFAALPDPAVPWKEDSSATWPEPLVLRHEVASIPSVSVLAALRARSFARRRRRPSGLLALLGDPVTDPADPRLPRPLSGRPPGTARGLSFPRLAHSGPEAAEIAALVPPGRLLAALGFAASRERVLSGELARYGLLHFSAHGLFAPAGPGGPALLLSRWDEAGQRRKGLLRASDLRGLHLPADLVTLAACDTAHEPAREPEGGGPAGLGLGQGFLAAGASRLLAGLWQVSDRSTADLMGRFYRALLHDGRPPGAALREAQVAMWRQERFAAPFHWAGFLLEGAPW
jgi:CHAT domain-containing protein